MLARPVRLLSKRAIQKSPAVFNSIRTPGHEARDKRGGGIGMDVGKILVVKLAQDQTRRLDRKPRSLLGHGDLLAGAKSRRRRWATPAEAAGWEDPCGLNRARNRPTPDGTVRIRTMAERAKDHTTPV